MTAHKKCKDLIANTCGTDMHQLQQMMTSFDNLKTNLPAPRQVKEVENVQVITDIRFSSEGEIFANYELGLCAHPNCN